MSDKKKTTKPRKLSRQEMEETKGGFFASLKTVSLNKNVRAIATANAARDISVAGGISAKIPGIDLGAVGNTVMCWW